MSRHEGVSCDACMKANFRGRRYKCLICYDYDLCSVCNENGSTTNQHTAEHPMQCILTRHDFDIFHGGEQLSSDHPQSLTCPFCGKMGFTEVTLQEHVLSTHSDVSYEVVCPICASVIGGDPNHITDDFTEHLAVEHQAVNNISESNSRHPMRRMPHQGRGVLRGGVSRQSMRFGDAMDPIAELLSQLSGVRRSTAGELTSSIHLHQEARMRRQMQLYRMESSNTNSGFVNPTGSVTKSQNNTSTSTTGEVVTSATGSSTQISHAPSSSAASSNPSIVPSYSTQASASSSSKTPGQPSFLLSRLVELEKEDSSGINSEKAAYVQELLFSTLSDSSAETNQPIVELVSNLNLRDTDDASEHNAATITSETGTQTDVLLVNPMQVSGGGGFPMSKSLAQTVLKNSKSNVRVARSNPRLQSPNDASLSHGRITGSGTVSVPPPVGSIDRGRISSAEPVSPGVNRRKPVRGDGRAHPPPN